MLIFMNVPMEIVSNHGFLGTFRAGFPCKDPSEATEAFLCVSDKMAGTSLFVSSNTSKFVNGDSSSVINLR